MPDNRDASRADALMEPVARGYTRARVLAAAVQARAKLTENSDAARRLSAEEVTALAEAIEAIDRAYRRRGCERKPVRRLLMAKQLIPRRSRPREGATRE